MNTNKQHLQWIYDRLARIHLEPTSVDYMQRLKAIIEHEASDEDAVTLTAFRHAANSIGIEAGIISQHVDHGEPAIGDAYFLELIRSAEQTLHRLSVKYERLRAAAIAVTNNYAGEPDGHVIEQLRWTLNYDL